MPEKKKIAFLLGAGVSQVYGFPSTTEITANAREALSNPKAERERVPVNGLQIDEVPRVASVNGAVSIVFNRLLSILDEYNTHNIPVSITYEQVYYIAHELSLMRIGINENMWLRELMQRIAKDLKLDLTPFEGNELGDLIRCGESIKKTIEYVVSEALAKELSIEALKKNTLVSDLIGLSKNYGMDIFTLNHDDLVEQLMRHQNVEYIDGFVSSSSGNRVWDRNLLTSDSDCPRIVHLHGSIYWHKSDAKTKKFFPDVLKYSGAPDSFLGFARKREPMFLTGTVNKFTEYTQGIFSEMLFCFEEVLRNTKLVVVLGYSFRDRGVNHLLYKWIDDTPDGRMIVLARSPGKIRVQISEFDFARCDDGLENAENLELVKADLNSFRFSGLKM